MISKQYFLVTILSLNLMTSSVGFSAEIKSIDCLAYWQLRSVGLSRDYGIASAKLSGKYHHRYQTDLNLLKQKQSPKVLTKGMFSAMKTMLEKIDKDYARTAELDDDYSAVCPLED